VTGLTFVAPPPGLGELTEFELYPVDGASGLFTLEPAGVPDLKMFLLDAGVYLPDYRPVLTDDHAARIGAAGPEEVATFVIASHRDGVTTVNLLAPIVVNNITDMCAQVILDGQDYDVRSILAAA
jgi:flagellar assembly factor FliW